FLLRYWRSSAAGHARRARAANIPLFGACLSAHEELAGPDGVGDLIRKNGWIRVLRHRTAIPPLEEQIGGLRELGLDIAFVEADALRALEPHLDQRAIEAAVHYRDPWTTTDPGGLTRAY